jgi:hypothetical protein
VEEGLQVIKIDSLWILFLPERSPLQAEDAMELLDICLKITYFPVGGQILSAKVCMAIGNSLSSVVSNIFMEHFEEISLDTADHEPV